MTYRELFARNAYALVGIFVATICVRFIWWEIALKYNPLMLDFDAGHYLDMARALLLRNGFIKIDGAPMLYRLPGYPACLWFIERFISDIPQTMLFVQTLLSALIPIQVFLCAYRLLHHRGAAFAAAVISIFHLGLNIYAGMFMTETIFCIVFLCFMALALDQRTYHRWSFLTLTALLWGLLMLIRPLDLMTLVVFAYALFRLKFLRFVWGMLVTALLPGLWMMRNYKLTGALVLHTLTGPHLINHGAVPVEMLAQNIDHSTAQERVYSKISQDLLPELALAQTEKNEITMNRVMIDVGTELLATYPLQTLQLCIKNMTKTVIGLYSSELLLMHTTGDLPPYNHDSLMTRASRYLNPPNASAWLRGVIWVEIVFHLMLLIGVIGFFLRHLRELYNRVMSHDHRALNYLLIALLSGALIALSCLCGYARFRLPVELFWIMLAMEFYLAVFTHARDISNEVQS